MTMSDIKDPARKVYKLMERRAHIDAQIAELQDKKEIINQEIKELKTSMRAGILEGYR